jgi:hypothetical protein
MSTFRSSGVLKVDSGKDWETSFEKDMLNEYLAGDWDERFAGLRIPMLGFKDFCDSNRWPVS